MPSKKSRRAEDIEICDVRVVHLERVSRARDEAVSQREAERGRGDVRV